MKKITMFAFLMLLTVPIFVISMEKEKESEGSESSRLESVNLEQEAGDTNWYSLPNETRMFILSLVVHNIMRAISEYSDNHNEESGNQKLVEIFKQWPRLKLIDNNIYELVCNNKEFIFIGQMINFWQSKFNVLDRDSVCFLNQAGSFGLVWALKLGLVRELDRGYILFIASRNALMEFCKELIEEGVLYGKDKVEGLYKAICLNECVVLNAIACDLANKTSDSRMETLGFAVECGNFEVIKLILGITGIEESNCERISPLFKASKWGQLEVIELLINQGACVNEQTYIGTPLYVAVVFGHIGAIKLLLENGALVNNRYRGRTVLMTAVEFDRIEIIELLLENGAKINLKDYDGKTALMHAVENNKIYIVKLLLSKNAKYIDQALSIAKEKNNLGVVSILEEHLEKYDNTEDEGEESDDEAPKPDCLLS